MKLWIVSEESDLESAIEDCGTIYSTRLGAMNASEPGDWIYTIECNEKIEVRNAGKTYVSVETNG